ncbi:MAG: phenylacetate--CoA ligase family protein [Phycisphaerae bacterium]
MGRPTFSLLKELEESQWLSAARLRELQADKLRQLFCHVSRSVHSYRQWFRTQQIEPASANPFAVLKRLPLVDKRTLAEQVVVWDRLSSRSNDPGAPGVRLSHIGRRVKLMSTGGSTGEPLRFLVDSVRSAYDKAARMRTHRWFGVEPGDKEAYLWGAPIANHRQGRAHALRDFFLNDLLLSAFNLSTDSTRRYLRKMAAFKPACVFGYPSSLAKFCQFARGLEQMPRLGALKAVFVTGEVLDDQQRNILEDFFQAPVADSYGGRDSGFCAHECEHGHMHVTSEHIVMEIIDTQAHGFESVGFGETGEIVVTNLDNFATPFIRYRTGDMGRRLDITCPCGRGLEVMDVVAGRRTDHLVASDGSLRHALSLIYLMRETEGVDQFQIHQQRDRSIDVQVVASRGLSEKSRDHVLRGVRKCLGESLSTRLHIVERIDCQPSGKLRHVVSEATEPTKRPG